MSWETFLTHPAVQALGRALLHFLWQGSLLALLLWMFKSMAPASPRVRYAAASLVMSMMPVALILTLGLGRTEPAPASVAMGAWSPSQSPAPGATLSAAAFSGPDAGFAGWVVCIWLAGVLVLSLWTAGGWMRALRLKRCVLAASGNAENMLQRMKRRLGVSAPVRLCTSTLVRVPLVIGWVRPYILLPVSAITGLSERQIEAVLAHDSPISGGTITS